MVGPLQAVLVFSTALLAVVERGVGDTNRMGSRRSHLRKPTRSLTKSARQACGAGLSKMQMSVRVPRVQPDRETAVLSFFPSLVAIHCSSSYAMVAALAFHKPILSLTSVLLCARYVVSDQQCYNPNGVAAPYAVCNASSTTGSACCGTGDPCTTTGYCAGSAGFLYRGGCTDKQFNSDSCASLCRGGKLLSQVQRAHRSS